MITKHLYKGRTWIDLDHPTIDEVKEIMTTYEIDPLVAHELTSPTPKPKIELHRNYIYAIFHFPAFKHSHKDGSTLQEVDFIIGKTFIITSRYDTVDALLHAGKVFEVDSILNKKTADHASGSLFFRLARELYNGLFDELSYIEDWISDIESRIFKGKEKEMVITLSEVSRDLLDFKRAMDQHETLLRSLKNAGSKILGDDFAFHISAIIGEYRKITDSMNSSIALVSELRETNNSLLSNKQNEQIRVITIFAFLVLPLSFIISLFQMELLSTPIKGTSGDFWIILFFLLVIGIGEYVFFKYKKWL